MMLVLVAAVIPPHFQAHPHARQYMFDMDYHVDMGQHDQPILVFFL